MVKLVLKKLDLKRLEPYERKRSRTVLRGLKRWQRLFDYPTIISLFLLNSSLLASDWAAELAEASRQQVVENLVAQCDKRAIMSDSNVNRLYVFVSFSMSEELLRRYSEEAKKYKAVIVLKGLPENSFKQLQARLLALFAPESDAAWQIDDEVFAQFAITQVPSMVLVQTKHALLANNKVVFDKITGNVGIRYALEKFAQDGELANLATEYLHG